MELGRDDRRTGLAVTDDLTKATLTVAADEVLVEDGCREGTPQGKLKTINGVGKIEDFSSNKAKMRVGYQLLITFNYWVLYKSPDKSWFISANPSTNR